MDQQALGKHPKRPRRLTQRSVAAAMALLQLLPLTAHAQQTQPTQYEYDAQGNLTKITDPNGTVTNQVPDNLDRLKTQTLPSPKTNVPRPVVNYDYDGLNRLINVTDPNGASTSYNYMGLDDVVQQSTDTGMLFSGYNKMGKLNTRYNGRSLESDITYDALNRPQFIYYTDDAGEAVGSTTLSYDAYSTAAGTENYGIGRLTGVVEYDAMDVLIATLSLRYDQFGHITRRCQYINGANTGAGCTNEGALYYRWAPVGTADAGRLLGLTYPAGDKASTNTTGRKVDYQYDALGHITGITTTEPGGSTATVVLTGIVYTPLAVAEGGYAPKSWNFGPSGSTPQQAYRRFYDTSGRPSYFSIGKGLSSVPNPGNQLGYDEAGRVMGLFSYNSAGTQISQVYGYDDLNRLTSASFSGAGNYTYDYDANGNRKLKTAAAVSTGYTYVAPSSRLGTVKVGSSASQSISDDTIGNITIDPAASVGSPVKYIYDNRNLAPYGRLVKTQGPGAQFSYLINHFGQRIRKTGANYTPPSSATITPASYIGSTDTVFYYDQQDHLIAEHDVATKQVKREYIWLYDTPVAVIAGATPSSPISATNLAKVYYIHTDHLDTPRLVTDTAGAKRWEWSIATSEPFGASPANEAPQGQAAAQQFAFNLRFPGQYLDKETGTFYNYNRTYNPATGRYLQSDPIGLQGGLNTYAYVGGNPLSGVDPTGLERWDWNGTGNTAVCKYYDAMATAHPKCSYYKAAADICRGNNGLVNGAVNTAITNAWARNTTQDSQATILEKIRQALVAADKKARDDGKVDCNTDCVYGNDIDKYHDAAFGAAGLSPSFYGGNLWPQGVPPNPVPSDPRNPIRPPGYSFGP
jgi:RHS repeat-associated protein